MAQFGGVPGLGPGGRRFESCHPDFFMQFSQSLDNAGNVDFTSIVGAFSYSLCMYKNPVICVFIHNQRLELVIFSND